MYSRLNTSRLHHAFKRKNFDKFLSWFHVALWSSQNVTSDTIFALSSGFGKCGVAVVRVSGPNVPLISMNIAGFKGVPEPRKVFLRMLKDPETGEDLDKGIFVYFKKPYSFTGEDCCELQVHGGAAVLTAMLRALAKLPGCRPAEQGEFTKRAFYAGKFDLTEVEGLADLINAETEAQRKQALLQMGGSLHDQYTSWRSTLLLNLAHLEAFIDFSEEESIDDNLLFKVTSSLRNFKLSVEKHLNDGVKGERIRNGVRTVIIGAPNVGKSSLLNILTNEELAIVSSSPGTTRDVVKTVLDICGYPVTLYDTAGLRLDTKDPIEIEGMNRAKAHAKLADFVIAVIDSVDFMNWSNSMGINLNLDEVITDYLINHFIKLGISDILDCIELLKNSSPAAEDNTYVSKRCLIVFNKCDLLNCDELTKKIRDSYSNVVAISCKTENGLCDLMNCLGKNLKYLCGSSSRENPFLSRERHRYHLLSCINSIERFLELSDRQLEMQIDIGAEHVRNAATELGKVTGNISAEDVLDVVFKQFCIGK